MKKMGIILMAVSTGMLTACASIVSGTHQKETFITRPSKANIQVDHVLRGKTPQTIELSRSDEHLIEIDLPGYRPERFKLTQKINGWYFGNILLGGLIGLVVDATDGAMYALEPSADVGLVDRLHTKKKTLTISLVKQVSSKSKVGKKIAQLESL